MKKRKLASMASLISSCTVNNVLIITCIAHPCCGITHTVWYHLRFQLYTLQKYFQHLDFDTQYHQFIFQLLEKGGEDLYLCWTLAFYFCVSPLLFIFKSLIFYEKKRNICMVLVECGVVIIRLHPIFYN